MLMYDVIYTMPGPGGENSNAKRRPTQKPSQRPTPSPEVVSAKSLLRISTLNIVRGQIVCCNRC